MARAVLFDAGGTLFHRVPSTEVCIAQVLASRGLVRDPRVLREAFRAAIRDDIIPPAGGEESAWLAFNEDLLRRADVVPDDPLVRALARALDENPRALYPDVLPTLRSLQERGIPMAIVSNYTHALPKVLADLRIERFFETVLYSWSHGTAKPNPRMFVDALSALGAAASESLMVGDTVEHDVLPAVALGMAGFWIDRIPDSPGLSRPRASQAAEAHPGVRLIHSLAEIVRFVDGPRTSA
ncbi:MAG: HAD family hydrolase [Thermoplasmatota archaeon]